MLKVATALPNEPYREYKDVERVYSGSTEIDKILDKNANVLFAVSKEVEGTPPLTYKGKEETNLKNYRIYGNTETLKRSYSGSAPLSFPIVDGSVSNYRIYGNTVNGESVGDRTGNLFDINLSHIPGYINNEGTMQNAGYPITTWDYLKVDSSTTYAIKAFNVKDETSDHINSRVSFYDINKNFLYRISAVSNGLFETPDRCAYVRFSIDYNLCDIMLIKSTSLPDIYEPYGYKVPVTVTNGTDMQTTNLYLPEQIKMVGDEAEYVDYATQKWHRVRKNLFSTELEQGNISIDGTLVDSESRLRTKNYLPCELGEYVLSFSGENIKFGCRYYDANYDLITSTSWMEKNSVFSIDRINTKYIKLNFAKNNTTENISPSDITDIQLEKGSTATEYEPYIENTEVDVTIPALPAQSSTNSLSVGTAVQPLSVAVDVSEVVSCGDRTGNLFDGEIELGSWKIDTQPCSKIVTNARMRNANFIKVDENSTYSITLSSKKNISLLIHFLDAQCNYISETTWKNNILNFNTPSQCEYINIIFKKGNNEVMALSDISNIMLNSGSEPLPYEPYGYKVPVTVSNGTDTLTTPIYLPEPIKMVGDEAEYVDYGEQKWHRVRKNLLKNTMARQIINGVTFTANEDGSITCNGTAGASAPSVLNITFTLPIELYEVSGCPDSGGNSAYRVDIRNNDSSVCNYNGHSVIDNGTGCLFDGGDNKNYCIRIAPGYTCNNLTFYPMIRKADIEDDIYEPYIENTDVDVTLPALPVLPGTNTLTVGTEVQPSNVYLKGRIKEIT